MTSIETATLPDWVDRELYPFETRLVRVGEHRIHYIDTDPDGSKPVLLMMHGNPTWSFLYREAIIALSDRFRCIAPDNPGFGLTETADGFDHLPESIAAVIEQFAQALGLERYILVGQDWGGPIAMHLAQAHPERVAGLVIGNTWSWPVTGVPSFERFSALMGGRFGTFMIRNLNAFVNALVPAGHTHRKVSRAEMRHYRRPLDTRARRVASAVLPRAIIDSHDFLARLEAGMPTLAGTDTLIVWGERDMAFHEQELERWQSYLPGAETVRLPDSGHYVQADDAPAFAAAIRAHFAP